jgi:hypothetical protein
MKAVRIIHTRHHSVPSPSGCRWCGDDHGHHGFQWVPSVGMHQFTEPTPAQVAARTRAGNGR